MSNRVPQIIGYEPGLHNKDFGKTVERLVSEGMYKDQSVVTIIPALNNVSTKFAAALCNLYAPPNQKKVTMWAQDMEVGEAYSQTIDQILAHPELSKFKYILTCETDNPMPADGLVRLIKQMDTHPEYSCIGGLYYTKGYNGVPQIWGDPKDPVLNFRPQPPVAGQLVECCGTGMGFNLFRMDVFRDKRLRKPWFKSAASATEGVFTQDLYFWSDARKHGHRCAIDCSILVSHVDGEGFSW